LRRELVHQRPTAVVCGSHLLAPWLLLALDDAKLTVPARASVVVYGDSDWAQASRPPLSVVRRDTFAEGHDLAAHLLATIEGTDPPRQTATEATFVDRGSCARARRR
jgi:DNA-binding LacI/PurR family transcriptional regulator